MKRKVVDATLGNDEAWRDFVREKNVGKRHLKITLFRTSRRLAATTLSVLLASAPGDDEP